MRKAVTVLVLVLLAAAHVRLLGKAAELHKTLPRGDATSLVLPSPLLRITSLGFKGLFSDFIFLDTIVYYGTILDRKERPRVKEWEWTWFEQSLQAATDLDPYFLDPYYFGNSIFSWEAGRVHMANALLEKGAAARTWDWIPPFLAGFNYFYFLGDYSNAADLVMEASRRPGANPMLASLASRLAYKEGRTIASIQFLEETLRRTDDEGIQKHLMKRINALRMISVLEQAVQIYHQRFHHHPKRIEDLVDKRILRAIPEDPYGGKFYLAEGREVKSTTDYLLLPTERNRKR